MIYYYCRGCKSEKENVIKKLSDENKKLELEGFLCEDCWREYDRRNYLSSFEL